MGAIALQINSMVPHLNEPEQALVLEIIKRFLPDDVASVEDLAAINIAREEYFRGETINANDINWN